MGKVILRNFHNELLSDWRVIGLDFIRQWKRERNFEYLSINRISGVKNKIPILSTEVHLDIP